MTTPLGIKKWQKMVSSLVSPLSRMLLILVRVTPQSQGVFLLHTRAVEATPLGSSQGVVGLT